MNVYLVFLHRPQNCHAQDQTKQTSLRKYLKASEILIYSISVLLKFFVNQLLDFQLLWRADKL